MNVLAVVLTQLVASHPHVDVAVERVGAGVWVARIDHEARVIGDDLRELPHGEKLRECLGAIKAPGGDDAGRGIDVASIPELLPLAGGRGVAVRVRERVCVVKTGTVEAPSAVWADSVLSRPPPREAQLMRQRLLKTPDARALPPVSTWPVAGTPLALTLTKDGVTVLRDGGVDLKLSAALRARLDVGDDLSGVSFAAGDGGVFLNRQLDTYEGACPAGEEFFDQALISWNGKSLDAPRLPTRTTLVERLLTHATTKLKFDARDAGDVWAMPVGPYELEQGTGVLRLTRDGGVAQAETKQLHALVRAACVDVPVFDVRGGFLSAVEEGPEGRCLHEVRGCSLTLELVDGHLVNLQGSPEGVSCVREALARDGGAETCTLLDPMLGLADYAFALELGRAGQPARMKARLEVALEKGLPEVERRAAQRLLR